VSAVAPVKSTSSAWGRTAEPVVAYVAGCGRSGSTLLDRILGQLPGVTAVGEFARLFQPGILDRHLCGCGEPVRGCPFWSAVAEQAVGGFDSVQFARMVQLRVRVSRTRHIPLTLAGSAAVPFSRHLQDYARLLDRWYSAISVVSGAHTVVDSSKELGHAYAIRRQLGSRLMLLHLVRVPQGVAYSWTKEVDKPQVGPERATLPRHRPAAVAMRWLTVNLLYDAMRPLGTPSALVRYEELIGAPERALRRLLPALGVRTDQPLQFLADRTVQLAPTHSVAGNPMRFRNGALALRLDEEWRAALPRHHQRLVGLVTAPVSRRYGYRQGALDD
jgi:hypothetical protein